MVVKQALSLLHSMKSHWIQRKTLWNLTMMDSEVAVEVRVVAVDIFRSVIIGVPAALSAVVVASVNSLGTSWHVSES